MSENIHFNFSIRRFHLSNPIFKIIQRLKYVVGYENSKKKKKKFRLNISLILCIVYNNCVGNLFSIVFCCDFIGSCP